MVEVDIVIDILLCGYMVFLDIIDPAWVYTRSNSIGTSGGCYRITPIESAIGVVPIASSRCADRKWSFCVTYRSLSGDRAEQNQIFSPR